MLEKKPVGLIAGIVVLTVLLFAGLTWAILRAPSKGALRGVGQPENVSFNDAGSPKVGKPDAKVVVHLYSDFQCPACKFAEPGVKAAIERYQDRVLFVWKDFPLQQHQHAKAAAQAARCVNDQGKFWEYVEILYAGQDDWSKAANPTSKFVEGGRVLGLSEEAFSACVAANTHAERVERDFVEGVANRVNSTPTFFIGSRRYSAMSLEAWSQALDEALR